MAHETETVAISATIKKTTRDLVQELATEHYNEVSFSKMVDILLLQAVKAHNGLKKTGK